MWKALQLLLALAGPLLVAACDTVVRIPLKKAPSTVRQTLTEFDSLDQENAQEVDAAFHESLFGTRRLSDASKPIEYLKNYMVRVWVFLVRPKPYRTAVRYEWYGPPQAVP